MPKIETDEKSSDVAKWSISVFCSKSKSAIGHTQKKKGRFLKKSNQDSLKKGKLFHSTLQMGIRRFQSSKCIKTKGVEVLHASIGTSIFKFLTLGCSDISTEHLIFNLENV